MSPITAETAQEAQVSIQDTTIIGPCYDYCELSLSVVSIFRLVPDIRTPSCRTSPELYT